MRFVIRDDDLNYFSKSADIERWYADIFAQGIPVGFSAIPFVKPVSDVYTAGVQAENKEYPIHGNTELVSYVRSNPLIEILQHGTTHETNNGYEYSKTSGLVDDTRRGKEELQKTFGAQFKNIFVPPHDWIGSHGVRAVEATHMNIIRGRGAGLRNWIPRFAYLRIFFMMLLFRLVHAFQTSFPAYPSVLDFGKHKEACSYRLEDTDVFDGLAYAKQKDGIFVVVTHLHFYTNEKKERLLRLIEKAREHGAAFVASSSLFS
ncbi:MAG: DUF2334 domain-containing protein [Candidatus Parcubacteria bacterium]|nr:DUF2334 domain-containing protein [Candidatus Parcubacteria bacterium]